MHWIISTGLLLLVACQTRQEQQKPAVIVTVSNDSLQQQAAVEEETKVQQEKYKKYWGYRFHIKGDFDGDGQRETLTEKLISTRTGQEIAKFCGFEDDTVPDCMWTWRINLYRQPKTFLYCSNQEIKSFAGADSMVTIGFEFLQNVGDLNGDGTDEIVYVKDYGGCNSGIREIHLATFKNRRWKNIIDVTTRLGSYLNFEEEGGLIVTPEDLSKPIVKHFEQTLKEEPLFFIKKGKKVFYKDYETAEEITKELKITW